MIEINSRIRHEREGEWRNENSHPKFSRATWGVIGTAAAWVGSNASWIVPAVAGVATTVYGADKQQQNQQDANAANQASIGQADLSAWQGYLAQRGVNPSGVTQFGQIPTNIQAINTKLPLWANVKMNPTAVAARSQSPMAPTNQSSAPTQRKAVGFKNGQLVFS